MRQHHIILALLSAGALSPSGAGDMKSEMWPAIAPLTRTYHVADAAVDALEVSLLSTTGEQLYHIDCGSYHQWPDPQFTGDWECHIRPLRTYGQQFYTPRYSSILSTNVYQTREWEHAAVFAADAIADEPDRARRVFRVRGLRIEMELANPTFRPAKRSGQTREFRQFDFTIRVSNDATAYRGILAECAGASADARSDPSGGSFPQVRAGRWDVRLPRIGDFAYASSPLSPDAAAVDIPIKDESGEVVYRFQCSNAAENLGVFPEPVIQTGVISCGLFARGSGRNLIGTCDPITVFPRSDFRREQLIGACAEYPDWGRSRVFRLRGMKLSITLEGIRLVRELPRTVITGLNMIVAVQPDETALCPIAENAAAADWRNDLPGFGCSSPRRRPVGSECPRAPD